MRLKIYFLSLSFLVFVMNFTNAQVQNGGFETFDGSASTSFYAIEYAPPWQSIYGTVDLGHPSTPGAYGSVSPNTGVGHMRLGHLNEYALGQTVALVAGQTYELSFNAKEEFGLVSSYTRTIGMQIRETDPTMGGFDPSIDFNPQVTITPTSTTSYEYASFCFTAQTSGIHYIVIGGKGEAIPPADAPYFAYHVDDVDCQLKTDLTDMPIASVTIPQTEYCIGDPITVNGSATTNETGYQWMICEILPSGGMVEIYDGGLVNGTAASLDVDAAFASASHTPQQGDCYRVVLFAENGCRVNDFVDFCYQDPDFNFTYNAGPVCEGQPINLSVTGNSDWTYDWYEGSGTGGALIQSGTGTGGFQTATVTPTIGNSTYTVVATTPPPASCTHMETITLTVHSNVNAAPTMTGVNGSGDYTVYVNEGDLVSFVAYTSNDNSVENVTLQQMNSVPGSISFLGNGGTSPTMTYSWTPGLGAAGTYSVTINASDDNVCTTADADFTYTIIVICDQCPLCVSYENRGPGSVSGVNLPPETKAGKCIEAGITETVSTGTANVLFQAGDYITQGPFFQAGPGYQGIIDPTTCVTDCEDCCANWTGFTYDPIQNIMIFNDGNPATSIWQMTDVNHPFCAFNATGYDLVITNQWGNEMHSSSYSTTACCPFESPSPENPISFSSIMWDGWTTNIWGTLVRPSDGVYYYLVTLYGCGNSVTLQGFFHTYGSSGMVLAPGDETVGPDDARAGSLSDETASIAEYEALSAALDVVPNPAIDHITITGDVAIDGVHLLDAQGRVLTTEIDINTRKLDVSALAQGTYYARIYVKDSYIIKKFVKQ